MKRIFIFEPYALKHKTAWNEFVRQSRNGTFLFDRAYMDYHSDRFADASWLILENDKVVALFPANRVGDRIESHGGLTYGGFILGMSSGAEFMLNLFEQFFGFLFASGVKQILYKTIPSIYHACQPRKIAMRCSATVRAWHAVIYFPSSQLTRANFQNLCAGRSHSVLAPRRV